MTFFGNGCVVWLFRHVTQFDQSDAMCFIIQSYDKNNTVARVSMGATATNMADVSLFLRLIFFSMSLTLVVLLLINKPSKAHHKCFPKCTAFDAAEFEMCLMQVTPRYCGTSHVLIKNGEWRKKKESENWNWWTYDDFCLLIIFFDSDTFHVWFISTHTA